jgi:hypothetical protein
MDQVGFEPTTSAMPAVARKAFQLPPGPQQ